MSMEVESTSEATIAGASDKPSRHVCLDCGRRYKAVETLNRHMKNHSTTTEYCCDVCEASFKRKDLLDRHMHIHSSDRPGSLAARSQRACVRCSRLKTRCDSSMPCSRCVRGGHECVYRDGGIHARAQRPDYSSRARTPSMASENASLGPTTKAPPVFPLDGLESFNSLDVGLDWNMDTSWLDSLPQVAPLSFGDGAFASQNINSNMLWDFTTATSPSSVSAVPMIPTPNFPQPDFQEPQWQPTQSPKMPQMAGKVDSNVHFDPSAFASVIGSGSIPENNALPSTLPPLNQEKCTREQLVSEMVQFATTRRERNSKPQERSEFWSYIAPKVESVFSIGETHPEHGHILLQFINTFFEKFSIMFPFLWRHTDLDSLPHYQYLVMSAIGAAFGNKPSLKFYSQTVSAMREKLISAAFQYELDDEEGLALCQTLLLIQAATLFFGVQKQLFAFPQQVGAAMLSLARRINLFNEDGPHHVERYLEELSPERKETPAKNNVDMQIRRRVATGIMRVEVFISMLVCARPLISSEEMNIYIPVSDVVWLGFEPGDALTALEVDSDALFLSDLVRIALDKDEPLPSNLQPFHLESILYGLQHFVWRFSQDPNLGRRLDIQFDDDENDNPEKCAPERHDRDMLDFSRRGMRDLRNDYERTITALRKWKTALTSSVRANHLSVERKSLLASYLLYNVSFMLLKADLASLHRLALRCIYDERLPATQLAATNEWAFSKRGAVALEHACSTWLLITNELRRPRTARAEFNILSGIALLHSAVVVWAYTGNHITPSDATIDSPAAGGGSTSGLRLWRGNNFALLQSFAKLLKEVQPMRQGVTTSAYHHTIATLAHRPIPQSLPT